MKKGFQVIIGLIMISSIVYVVYSEFFIVAKQTVASDENHAPDFSLLSLDGEEYVLSDREGKGVLVNFWATYCPPCEKEMPAIEKVYKEYKNKGVEIVAINVGEPRLIVNRFVKDRNLSFPILLDSDAEISKDYEVQTLPTTVLIDEKGRVVETIKGEMKEEEIRSYVERILPEK